MENRSPNPAEGQWLLCRNLTAGHARARISCRLRGEIVGTAVDDHPTPDNGMFAGERKVGEYFVEMCLAVGAGFKVPQVTHMMLS